MVTKPTAIGELSATNQTRLLRLERLLDKTSPAALQRVIDAPLPSWRRESRCDALQRRCLLGHVGDYKYMANGDYTICNDFCARPDPEDQVFIALSFDLLGALVGLEVLVPYLQSYAQAVLDQRKDAA
jgi:hypothetical protein